MIDAEDLVSSPSFEEAIVRERNKNMSRSALTREEAAVRAALKSMRDQRKTKKETAR